MRRPERPTDTSNPWSVPIAVIQIPETGVARDIEANPQEREAMATLGGLLGVASARASLLVTPIKGGHVHVTGRVWGRVGQTCVVTLDAMESDFDEAIDLMFAPPSQIRELAESAGGHRERRGDAGSAGANRKRHHRPWPTGHRRALSRA